MTPTSILVLARLAWLAPALLLFLSINQVLVTQDLRHTLREGTPATAEITEVDISGRSDVTGDFINLRVPLADGTVLVKERMPLPHSLAPLVVEQTEVAVLVAPGAALDVVIQDIAETQWRIALIQAFMSFGAFMMVGLGVLAWNRYLARHGDPAQRPHPDAPSNDPPPPAQDHAEARAPERDAGSSGPSETEVTA
ncbi:MAG: DUF3592 domain-containing protein [Bacteroidota bacterium]